MYSDIHFNQQIWSHISKYLTFRDILSLRSVNKELNAFCRLDFVWKNAVYNRWYFDELPSSGPFPKSNDYFQYFKSRFEDDLYLKHLIEELNKSGEPSFILKSAYSIINENDNRFVTVLKELKDDENLGIRYLSSSILNAIRAKNYYQNGFSEDIEAFFLNMCHLDIAFDTLLPFRKRFYDEIFSIISHSGIVKDKSMRNTEKVVFIIKAVQDLLQTRTDYRIDKNFRSDIMPSTEDNSILRVYAGEVVGLPEIRYSIIQKVCSMFKVKLKVCNSFMVIEDTSLVDGISLISLENDITILTKESLIEDLKKTGHSFNLELILNSFDFDTFNEPFAQIEDGSIYYHFKPHLATFNYIFPNSKMKISTFWLDLIYKQYGLNLINQDDNSLGALILLFQNSNPFLLIVFENELGRLFFRRNRTQKDTMFWLFEQFREAYYDYPASEITYDIIDPFFKLGQIVYLKRTNSYNVVLHEISKFDQVGLLLKNDHTQQTLVHEEDLELVSQVNDEVLRFLKSDLIIGKYFDYYDPVKQCFIPKSYILNRTSPGFLPGG